MTNCDEARIVNLLANNAGCSNQCLPSWMNSRHFRQQRKSRFEGNCFGFSRHRRQSKAIRCSWPSRDTPKLDEILRGKMQRLSALVQLIDGPIGDRMNRIGQIRKPYQDAGIDENCHYS